jgi:hypothetical protein
MPFSIARTLNEKRFEHVGSICLEITALPTSSFLPVSCLDEVEMSISPCFEFRSKVSWIKKSFDYSVLANLAVSLSALLLYSGMA